jgi:SPP1 gp7 family putative phage head morphogenesis protein
VTSRARTIALARQLRALGPIRQRRRGGRLPRQQQPDLVRLEYFKAIRYVVDDAHRAMSQHVPELVHRLEQLRRQQQVREGRADVVKGAPPPTGHHEADRARDLVGRAADSFARGFRPHELHAVAAQFGKRTSDFQRQQLDQQVRQAMGVPFTAIERPTQDRLPLFASSNVELIKTIPDRYFDRVIRDVSNAFIGGAHPETMAQQIADDYEIGLNDARRIARDQVGKLAAQVNQDRQESMGVTGFIWRTVHDNRVRDSHEKLDGQHFEWDDLPIDEDTGEEISPGSAIQCRCYAEPDFGPLLVGGAASDEE